MSALDNVVSVLRHWDAWKRIEEAPDRIAELEKRVADLEAKLAKAPGLACPRCGDWAMRLTQQGREMGGRDAYRMDTFTCESCGFEERRKTAV